MWHLSRRSRRANRAEILLFPVLYMGRSFHLQWKNKGFIELVVCEASISQILLWFDARLWISIGEGWPVADAS
jgi:hypothetical protein